MNWSKIVLGSCLLAFMVGLLSGMVMPSSIQNDTLFGLISVAMGSAGIILLYLGLQKK